MPSVMVLEGKTFGRGLGHEKRALRNEISVLIKQGPREPLCSFLHMRIQQEVSSLWPQRGLLSEPTVLTSWSQTSSTQNYEK